MGTVIIWLVIMVPVSALLTGLGIYAWRRKQPMWFWSGSTVSEYELIDIPAYNRANGIMWIAFSAVCWASTFLSLISMKIAGLILIIGCVICVPVLPFVYGKIYQKYRRKE